MARRLIRSLVVLALPVLLGACIAIQDTDGDQSSNPSASDPEPTATATPTASPTSVSTPGATAAETATSAPSPTATEAPATEPTPTEQAPVLLVTHKSGSADFEDGRIRPVDPVTLEPLPDVEPLDVGGYFSHAFSPDGRTLAMLVQPSRIGDGGLHLIDLDRWSETVVDASAIEGADSFRDADLPRFSPDGSALFWTQRTSGNDFALLRYDPDTESASTVTRLPESFSPTALSLFDDGEQAAVFGRPVSSDSFSNDSVTGYVELSENPARVLLVDLASGQVTATIRLEGVMAGSLMAEDAEEDDNWPIHISRPGLAWNEEHELLYVAHPGQERVTVVDLAAGTVQEQYDFSPPTSLLDQLAGWLFPSANGVARAITNAHAVLSADGDRLYTASMHEVWDGRQPEETDISALAVLDTATGETVDRLDLGGVHRMVLSPDREHLLVHTYPHIFPVDAGQEETDHRLYLLDPQTGSVQKELDLPGHRSGLAGESIIIAGSYAYLGVHTSEGYEVLVVDPVELEIVARHESQSETQIQSVLSP